MKTIDSHIHFWQYNPLRDLWITEDMATIRRSFMPQDLELKLRASNVGGCVAVQASQSDEETAFLLRLADQNAFIEGVVGWVDLKAPDLAEKLEYYAPFKKLKGWRHVVQAEPLGFMADSAFCKGIASLERFGYTYDILVYPHQLADALLLVKQFPNQPFVIDHCAKPTIKTGNIDSWKAEIQHIASYENVYCKLSGLLTEADWKHWEQAQIYRCLDIVVESFGTRRVMFGSDWPVMLLAAENYTAWKDLIYSYINPFSAKEKLAIFGGNATIFYGLK